VLLRDLTDLVLANCEPSGLSDEELISVAGDSVEVKGQRTKATHRAAVLETAIKTCRQCEDVSQPTPQKNILLPARPKAAAGAAVPAAVAQSDSSDDKDSDVRSKTPESSEGRYVGKTEIAAKKELFHTPKSSQPSSQGEQTPSYPKFTFHPTSGSSRLNGTTSLGLFGKK
jgi:hypothetical protein